MVFVVSYNDEEEEFDNPDDANEFAISTGLDFPDILIIEREDE